jgi:hypothetical protein
MEQEKKPKNKLNINKTWILVAILVIITGILLIVSLSSKSVFKEPSKPTPEKENFVKSTLMVSEDIKVGTQSGTYVVDIIAKPNGNKITVAQLEMSYDPKILRNIDINPGSFFQNPTVLAKKIDSTNGTIKFWIANPPSQPGVTTEGPIAIVTFSKSVSAPTPLNFMPKSSLSASGTDQSVLKEAVSGNIGTLPAFENPIISPTE